SERPGGRVTARWTRVVPLGRLRRISTLRTLFNRRVKAAVLRHGGHLPPPPALHADTRTPEYTSFKEIRPEKWESVSGMDKSFGFNRASLPGDFLSRKALSHSLVDIASKNGNLLLNVGPRGEDAQIPEPQLERLGWLASFTRTNGEALYGTRPWTRAEGTTAEGIPVRFTQRAGTLYAILLGQPSGDSPTLKDVGLPAGARVRLLGAGELSVCTQGTDLRLRLPETLPDEPAHAIAFA